MNLSNVGASVRQRLLSRARERGEDFQVLLTRYAHERLLYRLSRSDDQDRFVLKGAYAFLIWQGAAHRPTRDLDLLGFGASDLKALTGVFRRLCGVEVANDGVIFDPQTVRARPTREQAVYDGARIKLTAHIDTARITVQIDVGFGDAVTPGPLKTAFPTLLNFPAPRVRAYPRETVVAEKLHGIALLGMANSRMKDYFDLWYLSRHFPFDGAVLARAIAATFDRRGLPLPPDLPTGLSPSFAEDRQKRQQWNAFRRNVGEMQAEVSLQRLTGELRIFLQPVLRAIREGTLWDKQWEADGRWI
jgi:predicted nucleotidyltransferase component of viral defense system